MSDQRRDELIALLKDAARGLKWSLAIVLIMCISSCVFEKCNAQEIEFEQAALVRLKDGCIRPSIGASFVYNANRYVSISIDADIACGTSGYKTFIDNSSVVASLRTNLNNVLSLRQKSIVELRTGIGWAHTFGSMKTDHNFHNYVFGVMISREVIPYIYAYVSPLACWRSYSEHIGFAKERAWFRLESGIRIKLTKKIR